MAAVLSEACGSVSSLSLISVPFPTSRFVVYKLPAVSGSGDAAMRGLRYKYMDESTGGWRDGAGSINSSNGAVGRSLLPLYRSNSSQVTRRAEPGVGPWGDPPHLRENLHVVPVIPAARLCALQRPAASTQPGSGLFQAWTHQR
jgi:hypothetical protein